MRRRGGGILAPIRQEPDDFRKENYPFERGSRGETSGNPEPRTYITKHITG